MGCQTAIAQQIINRGGDYVLAVKDNQPTLARKLENEFHAWRLEGFKGIWHDHHRETDGDHGRIETRALWVVDDLAWLGEEARRWPGLKTAVLVEAHRQVGGGADSTQQRYYISSLPPTTPNTWPPYHARPQDLTIALLMRQVTSHRDF